MSCMSTDLNLKNMTFTSENEGTKNARDEGRYKCTYKSFDHISISDHTDRSNVMLLGKSSAADSFQSSEYQFCHHTFGVVVDMCVTLRRSLACADRPRKCTR